MNGAAVQPVPHGDRAADKAARGHDHARVHREEIPALLVRLATLDVPAVRRELQGSERGLAPQEVERRRAECGENRIAHERREPLVRQVLLRLANPLNLMLLALAGASVVMGDNRAALFIFVMVFLSLTLATVQERRSSRAAEQLRAMVHTTATVYREPEEGANTVGPQQSIEIPIEQLVPGDVVRLSAGDMIPADLRLIAAKDLFLNQASLTGESLPVEKHAAPVTGGAETDIAGMSNICFMGTTVVSGSATGIVALTGQRAYFGALAQAIAGERVPTSFDKGINRFTWLMIRFILVMAPLVFIINGLTKGDWVQALLFATAVAVGLTPEMLPMIVTVNLAKGAMAMSRRKVVVKRLAAIQNFGAMDVLCTDKTGTLTQDRVILQKALDLDGGDSREVLEYAYLNSYYQSGLKNLLDVAVLRHSQELEAVARSYRKFDEVPFDFERRRMSVALEGSGRRLLICKGAVEEVFAASSHGRAAGQSFALDDSHLVALRRSVDDLNADGFRVIAVAVKELPASQCVCALSDECDLLLVGYIAFLDPPKESAAQAIAALAKQGVAVKVLTGDNAAITRKVCREVGLPADQIVTGAELEGLTDAEVAALVEQTQVFARLSPTQKAAVIAGLQRNGHVVGFLGDGINDGAALKSADVGISVDSAVDIFKESCCS